MNEIERRALLGAAGMGAFAAMSKAGPLNPPGGAVASTGRTLDEVYNRIPTGAPVGAYDGRIPVSSSMAITAPGSYVLTNNIDSNIAGSGGTITIAASHVNLDLNGFTIFNSAGGWGLHLAGTLTSVTIRNGQFYGGYRGINDDGVTPGVVRGILLEDLRFEAQRYIGIQMLGGDSCIIRRCDLIDIGIGTTINDVNADVVGISYRGPVGRIEECNVHNLRYNGTGATSFLRGILASANPAPGVLISRCHVSSATQVNGIGINAFASGPIIRDCTVRNYTTTYDGGTSGGGNAG